MTPKEIQRRIRIVLRAFKWNYPLPEGFVERMDEYDNGTNRAEEMWGEDYCLRPNHERRCAEQTQVEEAKWIKWIMESE